MIVGQLVFEITGLRLSVNEIFALLGCYATFIGSYGRFGTTYRCHFHGSIFQGYT
jgi:hypothetical protein